MKRPRDIFDTPASSSPPMRRQKRQSLYRPHPPTFLSALPLPRRSQWAAAVPHDSPSNPFGLNRSLKALALPRPSGFAKHIVLRMQLVSQVEHRSRSRRIAPDAPFRIVQVPLSYSFRLLHELILFLFASDARLRVRRRRRVFSPSLYPHQPPPPSRRSRSHLEIFGESPKKEEGHLFEVFNDVSVYAHTYRPGVIKPGSGKLYARLSSARDRRLFPDGRQDEEEDDDVFGSTTIKPLAGTGNDDDEEWDWEGEDDFVLSNVWTDGPDLKKGVIYHHTPSLAIHITANTVRLPQRKGTGNTPYVFAARGGTSGAIRIANVIPGPMPTEEEIKRNMDAHAANSRRRKGRKDKKSMLSTSDDDSENDENRAHEDHSSGSRQRSSAIGKKSIFAHLGDEYDEVDDLDDGEEATEDQLERWNGHDTFQHFLAHEAARERVMRKHLEEPQSPAPKSSSHRSRTRTNMIGSATGSSSHTYGTRTLPPSHLYTNAQASSSSSSSVSLAPSSPSTLPIVIPSSDFDGDAEAWSDLDFDVDPSSDADASAPSAGESDTLRGRSIAPVYTIDLPLQTPFPANAGVRRRVSRLYRRIERQTSKGLSELSDSEEEERGELQPSQEREPQRGDSEERDEESEEDDPTAKRPVPVIASRGPDVVAGRRYFGGEYECGYDEERRRLEEEDSDEDFWEDEEITFVHVDDDSEEEL